ncbi:MAG: DUF881 domain-containing protein [Candidatus Limnocylindrales bacterium]
MASWQVTLGVAMLVLGFLVAAQLQGQAPRVRYSTQERPPLVQTAEELQLAQDQLKAQILSLREQIAGAQVSAAGNDARVSQLNDALREARTSAGLLEMEGPGVVLQLGDSTLPVPPDRAPGDYLVSANDLRDLIGELWIAGAEAVSVNGERIGVATAMTDIGTTVLINSAYLQAPYQVSAIGPDEMYDRLTTSPSFLQFVEGRVSPFGLELGVARPESVAVAAYAGNINLVESRAVDSSAPR